VLGVGLTKFIRDEAEFKIDEAASQAALSALRDARMRYKEVEMALCGNIYQTGAAPMVFYPLGKTGIPIARIDIACASASRAIQHAAYMIEAGAFETCLVVGVERMPRGMVPMPIDPQALSPKNEILLDGLMGLVTMPAAYAHKATRYMHAFGAKVEHFAQVSVKAHKNGCLALHAMYQNPHQWSNKSKLLHQILFWVIFLRLQIPKKLIFLNALFFTRLYSFPAPTTRSFKPFSLNASTANSIPFCLTNREKNR